MSLATRDADPAPAADLGFRLRWRRRLGWDTYHWWHEVLLLAVGYAVYTLIRDLLTADRSTAFRNARDVVHLEQHLGIFHELGVNAWLAPKQWLADGADYWYATAHFAVTIGVAAWILWKHPQLSRSLRIAWYSMNLYALIGFAFYPLAPPRFLNSSNGFPYHFVDTITTYGIWGSVGKKGSADGASNPFAAMPSMHIGWSTWCAIVIVCVSTTWWVRVLGALYPVVTFFVIIGTGNHFILDGVGGLVALALGFLTARVITRHGPFQPDPLPRRQPASTAVS